MSIIPLRHEDCEVMMQKCGSPNRGSLQTDMDDNFKAMTHWVGFEPNKGRFLLILVSGCPSVSTFDLFLGGRLHRMTSLLYRSGSWSLELTRSMRVGQVWAFDQNIA